MPDFESLPTDVGLRLNAICERFEDAWQQGERPTIASALVKETDPAARVVLLRELIQLDIHYRRRRGERPGADDCLPHFVEVGTAWLSETIRAGTAT